MQSKLLDWLETGLGDPKPVFPEAMINQAGGITGIENELQYIQTAVDNYRKLHTLVPFLSRKHKRLSDNFQLLSASLEAQPGNNAEDNASSQALAGVLKAMEGIRNELGEINLRIKQFIPELADITLLDPFIFLNADNELKKGMVSIIIIDENESTDLDQLFTSFSSHNTHSNYQFIIAGKPPAGHRRDIIDRWKERIPLEWFGIEPYYTRTYIKNLAADHSQGEYLLFLDHRAVIEQDILSLFLEAYHKHPSCGLVGAATEYAKAGDPATPTFQGSYRFAIHEAAWAPDVLFPAVDPAFLSETGMEMQVREFRNKEKVYISPKTPVVCLKPVPVLPAGDKDCISVPALSGSAMFCKKEDFMAVNGFDLNFFHDYEDISLSLDFTTRLKKNILLCHDIRIRMDEEVVDPAAAGFRMESMKYDLGVLTGKNGCYIKDKYLDDLLHGNKIWTGDTADTLAGSKSLVRSLANRGAGKDRVDEKSRTAKELVSSYLKGAADKLLRIAIKIPAFDNENLEFWGDYHFAKSLMNAFIRLGHPCRIDTFEHWYDHGWLTDDVVIVLRGIKDYRPRASQVNIMWNISHPEKTAGKEYLSFDYVFAASGFLADQLGLQGIPAECLYQCTDQELFYPDPVSGQATEKSNVLFVGNSRGEMRKSILFCHQKGIPVRLYGTGWEKLIPAEMIHGNFIMNEELRKYYSSCNILLNDHWDDMARAGIISNRIFDALACGAIVLTDRVTDIEKVLPQGLYYYSGADDLSDQIVHIKEHEREARHTALQLSKKVRKEHTFDQRAKRIFEVAQNIHRQKAMGDHQGFFSMKRLVKRWNIFSASLRNWFKT